MTKDKSFFRRAAQAVMEAENRRVQKRIDYFLGTHMPPARRKVN